MFKVFINSFVADLADPAITQIDYFFIYRFTSRSIFICTILAIENSRLISVICSPFFRRSCFLFFTGLIISLFPCINPFSVSFPVRFIICFCFFLVRLTVSFVKCFFLFLMCFPPSLYVFFIGLPPSFLPYFYFFKIGFTISYPIYFYLIRVGLAINFISLVMCFSLLFIHLLFRKRFYSSFSSFSNSKRISLILLAYL